MFWGVWMVFMGAMAILDARDTAPRGATRRERWTHIADTSQDAALKGAVGGVYLGVVVGLINHSATVGAFTAFGLGLVLALLFFVAHSYRQRWIDRRQVGTRASVVQRDNS